MLAPVRNDRKSAGKTPAVSAGSGVSRHFYCGVGTEAGGAQSFGSIRFGATRWLSSLILFAPSTSTRAMEAVEFWWRVGPIRSPGRVVGVMDFARPCSGSFWLLGMGI